jgi:hypothetical protein
MMIKPRRMRWMGHLAFIGEMRMHIKLLSENIMREGTNGRMVLKWAFKKQGVERYTGLNGLRIGSRSELL